MKNIINVKKNISRNSGVSKRAELGVLIIRICLMSVRRDISDTSLQAQSPTHLLLKHCVCKGQSKDGGAKTTCL